MKGGVGCDHLLNNWDKTQSAEGHRWIYVPHDKTLEAHHVHECECYGTVATGAGLKRLLGHKDDSVGFSSAAPQPNAGGLNTLFDQIFKSKVVQYSNLV